ncbi:MAG: medium chain dehydrogenase/reductase family protein [Proteobacteria bacterium]|nr:zinc-binding dehydrogenase [Desulfobacterales bacterium]MBL7102464.1 zinc-binding dehydrogenase [Desulfobacteraceae bacterium]MBL7172658.1 zinc-binding dehydrogenase [Desulfobacteraceae bacterium]MBU0736181.1 medium chain dehydrogenase/reductase family protein [Pseudomonadota bacterium]MBU1902010.1 medium chain dehydrogenase/reductase family protein [Pseudomonadota bacterium]
MSNPRKRIIVQRPGGYGAFRIDETPIEDPRPREIQVDIKACGINFADVAVRLGLYQAARGAYPICPGLEFAGVVRDPGGHSDGFKPGDRVFGASRFGAYATAINCPAEHLWHLPAGWDFARGASFPVVYLTAYHALHEVGHLRESDRVMVHSAAGGVGTALLHLLRINGNISVGVVGRPEKAASAKEAGAEFVIDKSAGDLLRRAGDISPAGYDLILDANGASTLRLSYRLLSPGGRLLIYGFASMFSHSGRKNPLKLIWYYLRTPRFNPFDLTGSNRTISGFNLIYLFDRVERFRRIMDTLLKWDSAGLIPSMPVRSFSFEDVANAHQAIESGKSVGKLVLMV